MGHAKKGSFRQAVLKAVLGGASTIDEVYGLVANQISAARAMTSCRQTDRGYVTQQRKGTAYGCGPPKRTAQEAIVRGKRRLVCNNLTRLLMAGKVRRVSPGVYAPPLPKIHDAEAG